jgi:hypothetical protein
VYEADRCSLRQSWRTLIVGLLPRALPITILRALRTSPPAFLAPYLAENPPLTLIHSLLAMVLGAFHLMEELILSHCLEARSEGGWMGLMLELLVSFFACVLSLTL